MYHCHIPHSPCVLILLFCYLDEFCNWAGCHGHHTYATLNGHTVRCPHDKPSCKRPRVHGPGYICQLLQKNGEHDAVYEGQKVKQIKDIVTAKQDSFEASILPCLESVIWGWHPLFHTFMTCHKLQTIQPSYPWKSLASCYRFESVASHSFDIFGSMGTSNYEDLHEGLGTAPSPPAPYVRQYSADGARVEHTWHVIYSMVGYEGHHGLGGFHNFPRSMETNVYRRLANTGSRIVLHSFTPDRGVVGGVRHKASNNGFQGHATMGYKGLINVYEVMVLDNEQPPHPPKLGRNLGVVTVYGRLERGVVHSRNMSAYAL